MSIQQLSPKDCSDLIARNSKIQCIDVREHYEYELGNIGFTNIPMSETASISEKFDPAQQTIIICRSGKRAEAVGNLLLKEFHFTEIIIVDGGLLAWKASIDSTIQLD